MSLLFLAMIANAMFYGRDGSEMRPKGISVGPISFTLGQLFISLISMIIVTPVNVIVVQLFKRARPKSMNILATELSQKSSRKSNSKEVGTLIEEQRQEQQQQQQDEEAILQKLLDSKAVGLKEKYLPHWVVYIGYTLVLLAVLSSSFFCVLYSQSWGRVKAREWLTTFLLSFF